MWIAPVGVALVGVAISCLAFWMVEQSDARRVRTVLDSRSEWRARDFEAKIRLSGVAVGNLAVAIAADAPLDVARFERIASQARRGHGYVNSLQWAPRVPRAEIAAFEQSARALGQRDYRVFDVSPDFRPTELAVRDEYFPVLFDVRFGGKRKVTGLALGRHDGRRIPMERARDQGQPVATLPVRPIGAPTDQLVYLLFWPVYDGVEVPAAPESRRARFRGYAVGNFNITRLLTDSVRETAPIAATIRFSITANGREGGPDKAAATYSPISRRFRAGALDPSRAEEPAVRIERAFTVFGQRWGLTFDYAPDAIAELRSRAAWGWLAAGLLLTAFLAFYLVRERGRTAAIAALVAERTAELERTSEQLHQVQKMEAIGNLTGGMAHDFNNLLTVVVGNLDLLQMRIKDDPKAAKFAEAAMQASLRGAELTRRLLAFARRQTLEPKLTDVNELVLGTTDILGRILAENVEITTVPGAGLPRVMVDPAQLSAAIVNLATNARDAMPSGGQLTIETKSVHLDAEFASGNPDVVPGEFVLIEVSDTGVGMSRETAARAFEPFFTTKEVGRGTGLGLSMVFGFVKQSRGHVSIYSEPGQGTVVRLYLPRAAADAAEPVGAEVPAARPHTGQAAILVVEDNAEVRRSVVEQLVALKYTVLEAENAEAALVQLKNPETRIDLLFTDLVMAGAMNGHELAQAALAARPGLKILYTSGYPGTVWSDGDRSRSERNFLGKPYRKQELAAKVAEILSA